MRDFFFKFDFNVEKVFRIFFKVLKEDFKELDLILVE